MRFGAKKKGALACAFFFWFVKCIIKREVSVIHSVMKKEFFIGILVTLC